MSDNLFKAHCYIAYSKITDEQQQKFKKFKNTEDRIRFVWQLITKKLSVTPDVDVKDFEYAKQQKIIGNKFYELDNMKAAIQAFSDGIMKCPHDSPEHRELLAFLVGNRSACLFAKREFKETINDLNYVFDLDIYPEAKQQKLLVRRARSYQALGDEAKARIDFDTVIKLLRKTTGQQVPDVSRQIINVENMIYNPFALVKDKNFGPKLPTTGYVPSVVHIHIHKNIRFDYRPDLGVYARATGDFRTGDFIGEEPANCAVVDKDYVLTNCQSCFKSLVNPLPCPNCSCVVFCSTTCLNSASLFHRFECPIYARLLAAEASVNVLMALRMITQNTMRFFKGYRTYLQRGFNDDSPTEQDVVPSISYLAAYRLCRNQKLTSDVNLMHYAIMAINLVNLLKNSSFFDGFDTEENHIYIATLICHNLQVLQFNSHEIAELRVSGSVNETECIGAGLYPTFARFNHSCDPSIIRFNVGNKLVARAIKPIKAGEPIFENYGFFYANHPKEIRQEQLFERYLFKCNCRACTENWLMYDMLYCRHLVTDFNFKCQTRGCNSAYRFPSDSNCLSFRCEVCHRLNNTFGAFQKLQQLRLWMPQAEDCYKKGRYTEATIIYLRALRLLNRYLKAPCEDMVNIQQRLRSLCLLTGNKSFQFYDDIVNRLEQV